MHRKQTVRKFSKQHLLKLNGALQDLFSSLHFPELSKSETMIMHYFRSHQHNFLKRTFVRL